VARVEPRATWRNILERASMARLVPTALLLGA